MLGKAISEEEQVKKILRSLSLGWQPLVTAVSQARNFKELKIEELIGTLLTHELLLNKMNEDMKGKKDKKTLALKVKEEKIRMCFMAIEEHEEEEDDMELEELEEAYKQLYRKYQSTKKELKKHQENS